MVMFPHGRSVGESGQYTFQVLERQKWFCSGESFVVRQVGGFYLGPVILVRSFYVLKFWTHFSNCLI